MSSENLTKRVAILEAKMGAVQQTAAAALALAAGADQDVADYRAEMRAHTRTLGALRETQLEQGQAITQQGQVIAQQGQAITQLSAAVDQIRDQHGARLNDIVGLLNHLIDRDRTQD